MSLYQGSISDVGVDEVVGVAVEADVGRISGERTPATTAGHAAAATLLVTTGTVILRRRLGFWKRKKRNEGFRQRAAAWGAQRGK